MLDLCSSALASFKIVRGEPLLLCRIRLSRRRTTWSSLLFGPNMTCLKVIGVRLKCLGLTTLKVSGLRLTSDQSLLR